ncbi:MAG: alpha/beta hydrolase [Treponema sp.]|jgi:acetyl esterase/lipase|nr:alpha/beta hydrolase [Treponema sp.]
MQCYTREVPLDYEKAGLFRPGKEAGLKVYLPDIIPGSINTPERPLVVLCPGGGYHFVSPREAEPVALQFLAANIAVVELTYSVKPALFPVSLFELAATVRWARENAAGLGVSPSRIIVCGFSAGGHLTASLCVYWNGGLLCKGLGCTAEAFKPDGAVLCYPVISGEKAIRHQGSLENLYGQDFSAEDEHAFSLEKHAGPHCPPAFIWHTATDEAVPVENSLAFAAALSRHKAPFELHVFPQGAHGLSLANRSVGIEESPEMAGLRHWPELAVDWIKGLHQSPANS